MQTLPERCPPSRPTLFPDALQPYQSPTLLPAALYRLTGRSLLQLSQLRLWVLPILILVAAVVRNQDAGIAELVLAEVLVEAHALVARQPARAKRDEWREGTRLNMCRQSAPTAGSSGLARACDASLMLRRCRPAGAHSRREMGCRKLPVETR